MNELNNNQKRVLDIINKEYPNTFFQWHNLSKYDISPNTLMSLVKRNYLNCFKVDGDSNYYWLLTAKISAADIQKHINEKINQRKKELYERYNFKNIEDMLYQEQRDGFRSMPDGDKKWGYYITCCIEYLKQNQWGFYRNAKLHMTQMLEREKRYEDAFRTLCEVICLDLSGIDCMDSKKISNNPPKYIEELAPGIIRMMQLYQKKYFNIDLKPFREKLLFTLNEQPAYKGWYKKEQYIPKALKLICGY